MQKEKPDSDQSGTITGAFILIGLGTLFMLINAGIIPDWGDAWPAILIVIGLAMLIGTIFKKKTTDEDKQI